MMRDEYVKRRKAAGMIAAVADRLFWAWCWKLGHTNGNVEEGLGAIAEAEAKYEGEQRAKG